MNSGTRLEKIERSIRTEAYCATMQDLLMTTYSPKRKLTADRTAACVYPMTKLMKANVGRRRERERARQSSRTDKRGGQCSQTLRNTSHDAELKFHSTVGLLPFGEIRNGDAKLQTCRLAVRA